MRGALLFGLALLSGAACSFPDVTYATADGSPGPREDAPATDGPPAGDAPADAAADEVGDAFAVDVTLPPDSSPETSAPDVVEETVFEAAADAPPCDQDQDGYKAQGACGGNDCDDLDPHTNPGVTSFQTAVPPATQPLKGDWNCDGRVQQQVPTNLACTGNAVLGCMGGNGFIQDPGCGGTGAFGTCESSGGLAPCMPVATTNDTQGCL